MGLFSKKSKELEICAPVDGILLPTSSLSDPVFGQDMMGKGVAIKPINNTFVAPFDGEMISVFPTGHAYGIQAKNGIQVLIHIGMDTVELKGQGFDVKVKQGQKVKKGDVLVIADLDLIKQNKKPIETPIIITSDHKNSLKDIKLSGTVKTGEIIYKV